MRTDKQPTIGDAPVISVLKQVALTATLTIATIGVAGLIFGMYGALAVGALWTLFWCVYGLMMLGMLVGAFANHGIYASANRTLAEGFSVDYIGRGAVCNGMAMVDEKAQKIFINKSVFPFSEISSWRTHMDENNKRHVEIATRSNAQPIFRVAFDNESDQLVFFQRLSNSMSQVA